jgi:hypothetical protein
MFPRPGETEPVQKISFVTKWATSTAVLAIVGNVSQGGGGTEKNGGQPHVPCGADECGPALLGHEQTIPLQMPGAGGTRVDGVSVPRGAGRGAKGQG